MKVFLTGRPGIGKTTVVKKFLELYHNRTIGFFTPEIRKNSKRIGFTLRLIPSGEELIFASVERISSIKFGKYYLDLDNLEKVVEKIENNLENYKLVIIDEIGRMEMISRRFKNFIDDLLKNSVNLLAVIHRTYVKDFSKYGKIIWVTEKNRNILPRELLKIFRSKSNT